LGRLPQLKRAHLFPVGFEPLGLFRLAVQRVHLPLDLADHVAQTQQVLLGGFHLPQGRGLAVLVFGDAGGFFDQNAPLLGFGVQNKIHLSLFDDGVSPMAHPGSQEEIGDVLQPAGDLVDKIFAFAGAKQPPADGDFRKVHVTGNRMTIFIGEGEDHFSHPLGFAGFRAVENHVFHGLAP
jgi:hypothetical protein